MRKMLTAFAVLAGMHVYALTPADFTITRVTAPYFIVDANSPATINAAYVAFEVKNNTGSTVTYSGLKLTISISTSIAGQNYTSLSPANGINNIGTLAPGEIRDCYFYVGYPASKTAQATFTTVLTDNTAGFKSQTFLIIDRSSISANAGGSATQTFTSQDLIGGIITDDVTYAVGNVQNNDETDFQVAVSPQFDPTKLILLKTQVTASTVPGISAGTTDSLYYITGNGSNGATVTVRWTFRISAYNYTNYLLPCSGATSGSTNYKYALNTALGSGSPVTIPAGANPLTISKTSDKSIYLINSAAVFTITIQNPGAYGVTIDRITDQLPAGFTFQSFAAGSDLTAANSTTIPALSSTGAITFEGAVFTAGNTSYYIPAGGSFVLKYTAMAPGAAASNLATVVKDYVGVTEVGSANNTVSVATVLAANLIDFSGEWQGKTARLNWSSSNEAGLQHYTMERSSDGITFLPLSDIGALNGSSINQYHYDDNIAGNTNYYRLKMVYDNGSSHYSNLVKLFNNKDISANPVYPNPVIRKMNMQVYSDKAQPATIYIRDIRGALILKKEFSLYSGMTTISSDLDIPSGEYLVEVKTASSDLHTKLIKK